jgi:hypothetical protein
MKDGPYPGGREFAFTIVDDTDHSTVQNVGPIYRLLADLGFRTTKTVWVRSPRDTFTGQSLEDPEYVEFARELIAGGFEIGLHNVGSGAFSRAEILEGLETYRRLLGEYPNLHVNHVSNPDNLYWSAERRFSPAVGNLYRILVRVAGLKRGGTRGEDPRSPHFWGDAAKKHIKYIRNLTFQSINTLQCDPRMPYRERSKEQFSNYWFSSSDGHGITEFVDLIHPTRVDRLARQRGACIVYTHFASGFCEGDRVHPEFENRLRYLAGLNGWFVPASTLLDFLLQRKAQEPDTVSDAYILRTNARWLVERIGKRLRYRR